MVAVQIHKRMEIGITDLNPCGKHGILSNNYVTTGAFHDDYRQLTNPDLAKKEPEGAAVICSYRLRGTVGSLDVKC